MRWPKGGSKKKKGIKNPQSERHDPETKKKKKSSAGEGRRAWARKGTKESLHRYAR